MTAEAGSPLLDSSGPEQETIKWIQANLIGQLQSFLQNRLRVLYAQKDFKEQEGSIRVSISLERKLISLGASGSRGRKSGTSRPRSAGTPSEQSLSQKLSITPSNESTSMEPKII